MADPFSIASGTVGMISLGITTCSALLKYYDSFKDVRKDVAAMYRSLQGLHKTFALIDSKIRGRNFDPDAVASITQSITSCEEGIVELEKRLKKFKMTENSSWKDNIHNSTNRLQYPLKEGTLTKLMATVSDLRANLGLAVIVLQIDVSARALDKLDRIDQQTATDHGKILKGIEKIQLTQATHDTHVQSQNQLNADQAAIVERQTIIDWLSSLSKVSFTNKHHDCLSRRQEGTGSWILESVEFKSWVQGKGKLLWCSGMPGAGKSIAMSLMIEQLQQTRVDGVAIIYVYCEYKQQDQDAPNLMLSLLQQAVQQRSCLDPEVREFWKFHSRQSLRPSVKQVASAFTRQIKNFGKAFILVDALDECTEQDGHRRQLVSNLQALLPDVNLLFTSREVPSIETLLKNANHMLIRAADRDIHEALASRMSEEPLLQEHIEDDPNLEHFIIDQIISKTNGMFLLADLHLSSLAKEDTKRGLHRALQALPLALSETYEQALHRIQNQDSIKVHRANQVLLWISHALRPLHKTELQHAISVEPDDAKFDEDGVPRIEALLSACCGLVVMDTLGFVILVHYTAQEFLEAIRTSRYPFGHSTIAKLSLTYLSFLDFADGPCLKTVPTINTLNRVEDQIGLLKRVKTFHFLIYAAQYWGDHARLGVDKDPKLLGLIQVFLERSNNISASLQAYGRFPRWYAGYPFAPKVSGLHLVSIFGLISVAMPLLTKGKSVHDQDSNLWTPLHYAAVHGQTGMVKFLLENGADPNALDRYGGSPLYLAAHASHEKITRILLEAGALESQGDRILGEVTVFEAAEQSHARLIRAMAVRLLDVETLEEEVHSAIQKAAESCYLPVLRLLEEVKIFGDIWKWMVLAMCWASDQAQADILIPHIHKTCGNSAGVYIDPDLESLSRFIKPAILKLAGRGHVNALRTLLSEIGKLRSLKQLKARALREASFRDQLTVMQLLLNDGTELGGTEMLDGTTNLHFAVSVEAIELLLWNYAVIDAVDNWGRTPLHMRCQDGPDNERLVSCLLDHGAQIDVRDKIGHTPLFEAVENQNKVIASCLLGWGANPNIADREGVVPMQLAAADRDIDLVRLFVKGGTAQDEHFCSQIVRLYRAFYKYPYIKMEPDWDDHRHINEGYLDNEERNDLKCLLRDGESDHEGEPDRSMVLRRDNLLRIGQPSNHERKKLLIIFFVDAEDARVAFEFAQKSRHAELEALLLDTRENGGFEAFIEKQ